MFVNFIKSVLFNLHFYILTFLLVIIMFPVLILPFWFIKIIAKIWGGILVLGMKIWLGLNLRIIGHYNKNKHSYTKNYYIAFYKTHHVISNHRYAS